MNDIYDIWDGNEIHPELNAGDYILKMCDHMKQTQNEWKLE